MVDSNAKGSRREREFRNYFREHDTGVAIRIPASGSGIDMDLPDVLVGGRYNGLDYPWAVELKAGSPSGNIYVEKEEVTALCTFADAFDATPLIGVRWDGDTTWYLHDPAELPITSSENVRLDPDDRDEYPRRVNRPDAY